MTDGGSYTSKFLAIPAYFVFDSTGKEIFHGVGGAATNDAQAAALRAMLDAPSLSLGPEPFRRIMRDPRFRAVPKILETPKGDHDEFTNDRKMLRRLRGYARPR